MSYSPFHGSRRMFLGGISAGLAYFTTPGLFAEELVKTPAQTEGPFYPDKMPLDTDNDLLILNDSITPAVGEITHLGGKILDSSGNPIRNAVVEIWQVDHQGAYLHTGSDNRERQDKNFQGFGRFLTGGSGEYYFRTIKPVAYPGRTPHIHYAVYLPGQQRRFTTQCYIKGEPLNARDGIYNSVRNPQQREAITVEFAPLPKSKIGELTANFNIVLNHTPEM
ncbi:MAG: protocatechuate 3,4-dioxygenase [Pirellulales bacterium]|nr:protocatechuate 3,4-dioxygenase [Pirellulales bacterium]